MSLERVAAPARKPGLLKTVLSILGLTLFGIAFALLLLEILLRAAFDVLPANLQADLQGVRRVPWSDRAIVPPVPFITDRRFQARLEPGLEDYPVRWHDARFTFDTGTVWEGHPIGLRTEGPQYPLDILAFGDSFTFCWTEVEDCWVQRLGSEFGWSVVNAGQPGTGSTGQVNLLEEIVPPMQPRLVVWQWYGNDLFDDYVLAWLNNETPPLAGAPGPDAVPAPEGLAEYSAVYRMLSVWFSRPAPSTPYRHTQLAPVEGRDLLVATNEYAHAFSMTYPAVEYGWTRSVEAHERAAQIAQDSGVQLLIVLVPPKEEAYAEFLTDTLGSDYLTALGESRRRMLALCEERGWHCLDALPAFQEAVGNGESVYYALDFHLDSSGNRILAALIHDYIVNNALLPER